MGHRIMRDWMEDPPTPWHKQDHTKIPGLEHLSKACANGSHNECCTPTCECECHTGEEPRFTPECADGEHRTCGTVNAMDELLYGVAFTCECECHEQEYGREPR